MAGADTQYKLPIFTTDTPYAGEKGSRLGCADAIPRSQSPQARCKTHDARSKTHDARCKSHDARSKTHDARCKTHDARSQSPRARCKSHDARCKTHDARCKSSVPKSKKRHGIRAGGGIDRLVRGALHVATVTSL